MAARNRGQQGESVNTNYMNFGYMKCSFPKGSDKWTYIYRISIAPLSVWRFKTANVRGPNKNREIRVDRIRKVCVQCIHATADVNRHVIGRSARSRLNCK